MLKFVIESSRVPIYDRIARGISGALISLGHRVYFIDVAGFSDRDFVDVINRLDFDCYLSTNEHNKIQEYSSLLGSFIFKKIDRPLVFLHHDNVFSGFVDPLYIFNKIQAYRDVDSHSAHYCLESANVELLQSCGITRCYKTAHASEFARFPDVVPLRHGASFVGHLMASLKEYPTDGLLCAGHLEALAWGRVSRSTFQIQPHLHSLVSEPFVRRSFGTVELGAAVLQQCLVANLNKLSSAYRGQLLSVVKSIPIDIIGGDLSYGRLNSPVLKLSQGNVRYLPATADYADAATVYRSSRVSINVSALQFDSAVNNRVIDVVLAGGFVLTDRRGDLSKITSCHQEISFDTPEEFVEKLEFYCHPGSSKLYEEVREQVYKDVSMSHRYEHTLAPILNELRSFA